MKKLYIHIDDHSHTIDEHLRCFKLHKLSTS